MAQLSEFLTPADLQKISNLQVLARLVVEGFCTGLHRSPHKGFSVEFKQHRQYVHGDEIRHLDWRVFGKTDRFYIREYEEETNLRCTMLLDASGSMNYGNPQGRSKLVYAQRLAACLAYLMLGEQDSVGLVTFDTKVRRYIPPRAQTSHLKVLVNELEATKPGGETELAQVFHDLVREVRPIVEHREQNALDFEMGISKLSDLLNGLHQFRNPFQRKVFTLNGYQDGVCGHKCIDSKEIHRWRTVNNQKVVTVPSL